MQMAPPSPPSCFPVLVISALRRLLPPLRSLCQARGRATVAGAPRPGAAAEPGAGCSQEDQKRSRRHPLLVLQHPQHSPPLRRRAAHGWRRELQRCVCEGGGCAWSSMSGGCVLFQGHSWGGGSLATVQGSSWGRELSSVEPRAGEHCPWGAARSEGRGSRREALSNAGPLGAYTGGGGTLCQGLLAERCLP